MTTAQKTTSTKTSAASKVHITRQIAPGKVTRNMAECGRGLFTKNGAVNQILAKIDFKNFVENEPTACCEICLQRAKDKNRV